MVWNHQSIKRIYSQIPDNKAQESYRCHNFPIDAVYTWVNGSDPKLLEELAKTKNQIQYSILSSNCIEKTCDFDDDCIETPIAFMSPIVENPHKIFDNVTKFENFKDKGSLIYFSSISTGIELYYVHSIQTFIVFILF